MNPTRQSLVIVLAVAPGLSGCGTPPNPLMGSGHTPTYVAGFNDGCQSGRASQNPAAGMYTRNTQQFNADKQYAEGWNAGFSKCSYAEMEEDAYGGRR